LTHHIFKGICCLFSPYNFCLLCDQSITLQILLLSDLNFKICTWFCTFFVRWLLATGHSLIVSISVSFWAKQVPISYKLYCKHGTKSCEHFFFTSYYPKSHFIIQWFYQIKYTWERQSRKCVFVWLLFQISVTFTIFHLFFL
jgi:hypothetical protein